MKQERRGLYSEILMTEVGQHGDNLIIMSECSNKGAYGFIAFQIIQELKLVLDSHGAACDVDLLDSDVMWFSARGWGSRTTSPPPLYRVFGVPIILIVVVVQVFGLIDGRECSYKSSASKYNTEAA